MTDPIIANFRCELAPNGAYRVEGTVNGQHVVGWVFDYMKDPTPTVAASMANQAEAEREQTAYPAIESRDGGSDKEPA